MPITRLTIVQYRVSLAERSASTILSRHADGVSGYDERSKRSQFSGRPVDRLFSGGHFPTGNHEVLQLAVDVKIGWNRGHTV